MIGTIDLTSIQSVPSWTRLDSAEELAELAMEVDEGWLAALDLVNKVVDYSRFLPIAALHRVMEEALLVHKDQVVRTAALATLLRCLDCRPPCAATSTYYLELMSIHRPHLDLAPGRRWEFDPEEPWAFLQAAIEGASRAEEAGEEAAGPLLLLQFLTELLTRDLAAWQEEQAAADSLAVGWRPLLAHILFPHTAAWGRRLERLCRLYSAAPGPALRALVGLAAQLLSHKERVAARGSNESKVEMARCLAALLAGKGLGAERLGAEVSPVHLHVPLTPQLYLLQPAWLAALVSSALLHRLYGREEGETTSLRSLITGFINISVSEMPEVPAPLLVSTPKPKPSALGSKSSAPSLLSPKPGRKVNVTKRNQYGEIVLHGFAKKGNLARMRECLLTPGLDINSRDNNGWTPLHEAVVSGNQEAVRLLVEHQPSSRTLHHFFSPSTAARRPGRVDLLAGDKEHGMNPVQEAVSHDQVEMVRFLLDTVAARSPGLATLQEVLAARTAGGLVLADLARSTPMEELLASYTGGREEVPCPLQLADPGLFAIILHQVTARISIPALPLMLTRGGQAA